MSNQEAVPGGVSKPNALAVSRTKEFSNEYYTPAELWDIAFHRLQEKDKDTANLLQASGSSAQESVVTVIKDIERKKNSFEDGGWNISFSRGTGKKPKVVNVRQIVSSIMEAALEFKDVIDSVLAFDATKYGALAWSVVSFGLNVALNAKTHREAVFQGAVFLAKELQRYVRICAQYLRKSTTGRGALMNGIIGAYIALLRYSAEIRKLGDQSFLTNFKENLNSKSSLDPLQVDIQKAYSEVQEYIQDIRAETLDADSTEIKDKLDKLRERAIHSRELLMGIDKYLQASYKATVLDWVSPLGDSAHTNIRNKLQDNIKDQAGKWLLRRSKFEDWETSASAAGLWLQGKVGTGKTILTSTVIEYIRNKYDTSVVPVAVFYCSGTREAYGNTSEGNASADASNILRCMLRQFGQTREGFEVLAAKHDSRKDKTSELLNDETKNLLRQLVEMHERSFIILDAMDECDTLSMAGERFNLMELFNKLLEEQNSAKIFVSSRFELDIDEQMNDWPTIYVDAASTKEDLNIYVDRTIDRKLQRKKHCTDELRNQLKRQLKDRADGYFRWAQISLDYICDRRPASNLLSVLESIPDDLNDFYFKLLSEVIGDRSDFNKKVGTKALRWLLGTTGEVSSLTTTQFIPAIGFGWEKEDECIDIVRVACHQLVVWNESSRQFEFGHFSVAEFFSGDQRTHRHHDEVQREFGPDKVWSEISETCARLVAESGGSTMPVPHASNYALTYWKLFSRHAREDFLRWSKGFQLQQGARDSPEPLRTVKAAIIGNGVDFDYIRSSTQKFIGRSFINMVGAESQWWRAESPHASFIVSTIQDINPACEFYVAKVCHNRHEALGVDDKVMEAIEWALDISAVIILIDKDLSQTKELQTCLQRAKDGDAIILCTTFGDESLIPAAGSSMIESTAVSGTNPYTNTELDATYTFQGDTSVGKIMHHMGDISDSIATSVLTGIVSLVLSSASEYDVLAQGRRKIVGEWLGKLTERNEALQTQKEREGEMEEQHVKPWSLLKGSVASKDELRPWLTAKFL